MDQYAIRANDDYPYEDAYDALYSAPPLGRWVAVLGDETYFRMVNTRFAAAACDALAEAIGQEYRTTHRRCRPRHPQILRVPRRRPAAPAAATTSSPCDHG
jgi:hypothetical protein